MNTAWKVAVFLFISASLTFLAGCREGTVPSRQTSKEPGTGLSYLDWNRATLAKQYETGSYRNPKWDSVVIEALESFAMYRAESKPEHLSATMQLVEKAIQLGCDDPMIEYLDRWRVYGEPNETSQQGAEAYSEIAQKLDSSHYSEVRKFWASLRAAEALKAQAKKSTDRVFHFRNNAAHYLEYLLSEPSFPVEEASSAMENMFFMLRNNTNQFGLQVELLYPLSFKRWPDHPLMHALWGGIYVGYAWDARGSDWADNVKDEVWPIFWDRLRVAENHLLKAWNLNVNTSEVAHKMMTVCLGLEKPREEMEVWFSRAMLINPNDHRACSKKLTSLQPKWGGSPELMLEFARQCVSSTNWGGRVPLIMVDAHEALVSYFEDEKAKLNHWKRPEVWEDLKPAFEKFFQLNPDAISWRHNYAMYAYLCEQYDEFRTQLKLMGPVNYNYFGGRAAFDKMIEDMENTLPR